MSRFRTKLRLWAVALSLGFTACQTAVETPNPPTPEVCPEEEVVDLRTEMGAIVAFEASVFGSRDRARTVQRPDELRGFFNEHAGWIEVDFGEYTVLLEVDGSLLARSYFHELWIADDSGIRRASIGSQVRALDRPDGTMVLAMDVHDGDAWYFVYVSYGENLRG